jgi:thiol-disulfide isomerase/thioredoxin
MSGRRGAWCLASIALLASLAQAAPNAEGLYARCPGGAPSRDVMGRAIDAEFWRAGPVLAVFWSVDCAFCRRHNERLGRLSQEPSMGLTRVLGVSVDGRLDTVRSAVQKRGYPFPVIVDGTGPCALQPQLTERRLVPMTCWLGPAPTQPRCIPGEMGEDDLRDLLRQGGGC